MFKKLIGSFIFLITFSGISQEVKEIDTLKKIRFTVFLKGQVISHKDKTPLKGANLFNLNSVFGTASNDAGKFELATAVNDTVYVSYLGYQSIKLKVTNDLLKGNELVIELYEKTEQIKEVVVKSNKLIGVLEIDAKNVPKDKFSRIHISGLPQTYEVGTPTKKSYTSPVAALFHPIDFVYNMFGKKPKQLRKLKKLRDDSAIRSLLESKINRELMMEYLDMNSQELNDLLNECNYSDYFIKSASDLQLVEAVLLCYENYKAIKKGSTIKDKN